MVTVESRMRGQYFVVNNLGGADAVLQQGVTPPAVAAEDWRDYREGSTAIEHLAAYGLFPEDLVITGGEEPEVLTGAAVSANFFRTFGVDAVRAVWRDEKAIEEATGQSLDELDRNWRTHLAKPQFEADVDWKDVEERGCG